MRFRPCIDIHNGKVKQIVGGSLKDEGNQVSTNFTSELDAAWYARQYQKDHLKGGHIILLNPVGSEYYEATKKQAMGALAAYPGGMQIGGGITADNAQEYLDSGASHVIVTSYVFKDGIFHEERLQKLVAAVGKEHVVLDLSCRRKDGKFYVVTDRWQKFTELALSHEVLNDLSKYCDEFLNGNRISKDAWELGRNPNHLCRWNRINGRSGEISKRERRKSRLYNRKRS